MLLALLAGLLMLTACTTGSGGGAGPTSSTTGAASTPPPATSPAPPVTTTPATTAPPTTAPVSTAPTGRPVHIKTLNSDGQTYGVGMPIIAYFSKKITDASTLVADTKVTQNGKPLDGAWYFETSAAQPGYPIEGHWRPQKYWPANAQIHVDLPMKGKSAGTGLVYNDSLTLDFAIGPRHLVKVSNRKHTVTVYSGGKKWGSFPTSLGAAATPTLRGTKVIMEKLTSVCMSGNPPNGPSYHECGVKWDQRLTYGGEYLHAAPWNTYNIGHGVNSSNGCTNLYTSDAEKLYHFLRIGDPVEYPDATGPTMQLGDGYGDWNVPWAQWRAGGLISTT